MSASRKATAAAYLAVMLKVLVVMVIVYAMDGQRPASALPVLFVVEDAFGGEARGIAAHEYVASENLKSDVAQALVTLLKSHDLDIRLTVFGENMPKAVARAATVAQLLQKSGIPSSSLQVIGSWRPEIAANTPEMNRIVAMRRGI